MILPAYSPEIEMILTVQVHCDWRKGRREGIKEVFLVRVTGYSVPSVQMGWEGESSETMRTPDHRLRKSNKSTPWAMLTAMHAVVWRDCVPYKIDSN